MRFGHPGGALDVIFVGFQMSAAYSRNRQRKRQTPRTRELQEAAGRRRVGRRESTKRKPPESMSELNGEGVRLWSRRDGLSYPTA